MNRKYDQLIVSSIYQILKMFILELKCKRIVDIYMDELKQIGFFKILIFISGCEIDKMLEVIGIRYI